MMNKAKLRRQAAKIMIVDDEEIVTRSIANLIQLETDYHLLTFQSPEEALRAMQSEPIDCIITDFLMPEMDGLAFLKKANSIDPEMPKILLTGYADKENAIRAINEANIFQYLEKPWDNDNLKLVIRNAVNQRSMQQSLTERLRELDRTIVDRDSFRHTAQQLESELELAQEVKVNWNWPKRCRCRSCPEDRWLMRTSNFSTAIIQPAGWAATFLTSPSPGPDVSMRLSPMWRGTAQPRPWEPCWSRLSSVRLRPAAYAATTSWPR